MGCGREASSLDKGTVECEPVEQIEGEEAVASVSGGGLFILNRWG